MITMDIGLFGMIILVFFLGGGAVGWLLRGLRKCECVEPSDELIANLKRIMSND